MMFVEHEVDRNKSAVEKGAIKDTEAGKAVKAEDVSVKEPTEKEKLQAILDEAGIEYSKQLGVAKLQKLVDELQKEPEAE